MTFQLASSAPLYTAVLIAAFFGLTLVAGLCAHSAITHFVSWYQRISVPQYPVRFAH